MIINFIVIIIFLLFILFYYIIISVIYSWVSFVTSRKKCVSQARKKRVQIKPV